MVRYFILFLIFSFLFLSCNSGEKENDFDNKKSTTNKYNVLSDEDYDTEGEIEDHEIISDSNSLLIEDFIINGYSFTIYKGNIPDHIFFEDKEGVYTRSRELELIDDFGAVNRLNGTLLFLINDDYVMSLSDQQFDQDALNVEDVRNYYFQGKLEGVDYWKVFFLAHEYSGSLLMNQNTGEKVYTLNNYVFAADTSFVLFYNSDIEARFEENGFHLLNHQNQKLIDSGIKEFDMWGPKAIVYDERTNLFYVQRVFIDGYNTEMDTVLMSISPYDAETDS